MFDYLNGMAVQFKSWACKLVVNQYADNGRLALTLVDSSTGERVAAATVNVPQEPLTLGEVIIKDYSENEGMLAALVSAGIVQPTGYSVQTGFVTCPICRIQSCEDEDDFEDEGGEDAACGNGCGQEPMGCGSCGEMGYDAYEGCHDEMRDW